MTEARVSSAPARSRVRRTVVVGGGAAGLFAARALAQANVPVTLLSRAPARHSGSVLERANVRATRPDDAEALQQHLEDTLSAGFGLAEPAIVRSLVGSAHRLVDALGRLGVPFESIAGEHACWSAHGFTGREVVYALDAELRRLESLPARDERGLVFPGERLVERLEGWSLSGLLRSDAGTVVGVIADDAENLETRAFPADGVCLATGGFVPVFGWTTFGGCSAGTGSAVALEAGAVFQNPELVWFHPLSAVTARKALPLDTGLLTAGGRVFVANDPADARSPARIPEAERDYVLERLGVSPTDAVAIGRALFEACRVRAHAEGARDGARDPTAYLDLAAVRLASLPARVRATLDVCAALSGTDPRLEPVPVLPAAHHALGGLWIDFETGSGGTLSPDSPRNQATSLPGLYACGEAAACHGAGLVPENALLASLHAAEVAAGALVAYRKGLPAGADERAAAFDGQCADAAARIEERLARDGTGPSPFELRDRLGALMVRALGGTREDEVLAALSGELEALSGDVRRARLVDRRRVRNPSHDALRDVESSLLLAEFVVAGARHRADSRGVHEKAGGALAVEGPGRHTLARLGEDGRVDIVSGFEYSCAGRTLTATDRVRARLDRGDPKVNAT
jgi:succinate dehydrogenase / fumarate reductase flavoprotein subunit